jgi:hypothetical protein
MMNAAQGASKTDSAIVLKLQVTRMILQIRLLLGS